MAKDGMLHLSPILPLSPDWHALATELAFAYTDLQIVTNLVQLGHASGYRYWRAHNRVEKATQAILCWHDMPDVYGRMLAREQWLKDQPLP